MGLSKIAYAIRVLLAILVSFHGNSGYGKSSSKVKRACFSECVQLKIFFPFIKNVVKGKKVSMPPCEMMKI